MGETIKKMKEKRQSDMEIYLFFLDIYFACVYSDRVEQENQEKRLEDAHQ